MRHEVTSEWVRSVFDYDPEIGDLRVKKRRQGSPLNVGDVAGFPTTGGYIGVSIGGSVQYLQRIIWLYVHGRWPRFGVDHINGIKTDNRLANLREATKSQNGCNRGSTRGALCPLKGVTPHCRVPRRWVAKIGLAYRTIYIGTFDCPAAAHFAYCIEADRLHGEFARAA